MSGAYIFDDVMASDYLKSQNLIISIMKELLKRNEKHVSLFHKCSLLDLQNKADTTFNINSKHRINTIYVINTE